MENTCKDTLPFSITFDLEGNVVVLDSTGNKICPKKARFPIETRAIANIQQITAIEIHGSHFLRIQCGDAVWTVDLPH